jgi:translation initiation factor 2 subunit 1
MQKCEEKYNKSKAVHSIMRHVAERKNLVLEELYSQIGWPLYRKFGHAYDAFKMALTEPEAVLEGMKVDEDVKLELLSNITRRLTPQKVKIRADIEVVCFAYDGIDAVKSALISGKSFSTEELPLSIKLVAPPLYVLTTTTLDKQLGIDLLEKTILRIEENIKKSGGSMLVKRKPKAVSETDELELAEMMKRVELENAEVSGDEDTSEPEVL